MRAAATRVRFGLDPDRPLVLGVSRLVPRKGFDVVIDACRVLTGVQLAIGGAGRDRDRLERRAGGDARRSSVGCPMPSLPALYARRRRVRDVLSGTVGRARSRRVRHRVPRSGRVRCSERGRVAAADPTRPSSTARPASSSNPTMSTASGPRSARSSKTRISAIAWALRARTRAIEHFSYDSARERASRPSPPVTSRRSD